MSSLAETGPTAELTADVGHESLEIHVLECLDLSSDELGLLLLPQCGKGLHPQRWIENWDDLMWRSLVRGEEGDDGSVWKEAKVTVVDDFVGDMDPGVV